MDGVLNYLLDSTAITAVLCLFFILFLRKDKNFNFNRWYLLATPLLAASIPLLNISIPMLVQKNNLLQTIYLPTLSIGDVKPENLPFATYLSITTAIVYLAGVFISSLKTYFRLKRLYNIISGAKTRIIDYGRYKLVPANGQLPTGSFLQYIFYDESSVMTKDQRKQVLMHEKAHVMQRHSYDLLYFEILEVVMWFNPFIYLCRKELLTVHEYLADEAATASKSNKETYLRVLADQTLETFKMSFYNQFNTPQIIKRMNMLQSNQRRRPMAWNLLFTTPLVVLLFIAFGCEKAETSQYGELAKGTESAVTSTGPSDTHGSSDALSGEIYQEVDQIPEPEGGIQELMRHVMQNITYPATARESGIEGKVYVQFVVDKNGKITNVQAVKGIGGGCDEEAVRVVSSGPKFNPGIKDGKPVNTQMILPVTFKLDVRDKSKEENTSIPTSSKEEVEKSVTVVGYKQ